MKGIILFSFGPPGSEPFRCFVNYKSFGCCPFINCWINPKHSCIFAIADAVAAIGIPVVEVHISNVLAREEYRKTSFIASKCVGSISGLGMDGYALAIQYFTDRLAPKAS
jgi:3-dehydroquinate dehydratase